MPFNFCKSAAAAVFKLTFSLFALFLAFSLGYHLAKSLETNRLAGAIVSLASFTMSVANFTKLRVNGKNFFVHNAFDISQFSTTGIFTAILFGTIGVAIYVACYKARIIIHLSTSLPH
ncbi:PTS transporter subunit EIIC, partial [Clostridium sp.]|uniref:PTS transporter subunit EIIC n=1 Tax=Clostridium sp. TaxID=1506 RepID=UPI0035A0565B